MAGSSIGTNIKRWYLSDLEICFNLEETPDTYSSTEAALWKLFVPKIMPLMEMGLPKETPVQLSDSLFINDKACKPSINSVIYQRNYLKATRPDNCSFAYELKFHTMKLEVEVLHVNLDNLRITNHIDNSIPPVDERVGF